MIIERINGLVERMQSVVKAEDRAQKVREHEEAEQRYRELVQVVTEFVNAIWYARNHLSFVPSQELSNGIQGLLGELESMQTNDQIDKASNQLANKHLGGARARMRKEWESHYTKLTDVREILKIVRPLDAASVDKSLSDIERGRDWTSNCDTLRQLHDSLHEAHELVEQLDMDDDIVGFLVKVTNRTARFSDLSDSVIDWINREGIENRISLNFVAG